MSGCCLHNSICICVVETVLETEMFAIFPTITAEKWQLLVYEMGYFLPYRIKKNVSMYLGILLVSYFEKRLGVATEKR